MADLIMPTSENTDAMVLLIPTDAKTWTKLVQIAAVGNADRNDKLASTLSRTFTNSRFLYALK